MPVSNFSKTFRSRFALIEKLNPFPAKYNCKVFVLLERLLHKKPRQYWRINAAAQENAERHVANHLALHAIGEKLSQSFFLVLMRTVAVYSFDLARLPEAS